MGVVVHSWEAFLELGYIWQQYLSVRNVYVETCRSTYSITVQTKAVTRTVKNCAFCSINAMYIRISTTLGKIIL